MFLFLDIKDMKYPLLNHEISFDLYSHKKYGVYVFIPSIHCLLDYQKTIQLLLLILDSSQEDDCAVQAGPWAVVQTVPLWLWSEGPQVCAGHGGWAEERSSRLAGG